jgi:hypothetical protein
MTPREFLELVVRPNVNEFHTDFADQRRAHNAVSAVDALAAHIYVWARTNAPSAVATAGDDSHYRNQLAGRNSDFALLRDVAKAQKHVHLGRHNPQTTRADQITARPIGYGEGPYGAGRYGGVEQVVVDIASGDFAYLENVVDQALAFLEAELVALGA